jgi:hypothetical protein
MQSTDEVYPLIERSWQHFITRLVKSLQLKWLMMATDVVLTHGKHFQFECHCQLVLVNFFGL